MSKKEVYILHKNGAPNHYIALDFLLEKHGIKLKHREFSILSTAFKALLRMDGKRFYKQIVNACFMINLLFSKNKVVVIGIAPFDHKLNIILKFLKKHHCYYHTSWTYWDLSFHPKTKKVTEKVLATWKNFIENKVLHIFAVTLQSKKQLLQNYSITDAKIHVVNHSIDEAFTKKHSQ